MIEKHEITVDKTARYYMLEPKGEPRAVVFAIHGYRQQAQFFIKQFQVLANTGVRVVAPEGLHRFYIEGYSGRVGASWMTKEDRETDITDYLAYLNRLYGALKPNIGELPVHLLGFSQGGATACRWLGASDIPFKSLLLYASVFPNDFDFNLHRNRLSNVKQAIAFGDTDQFASEEIISQKMSWLESKNVSPTMIRYSGGHEIYDSVLRDMWDFAKG